MLRFNLSCIRLHYRNVKSIEQLNLFTLKYYLNPAVFLIFCFVIVSGDLAYQEVVYEWIVDGERHSVSALPVFDWIFLEVQAHNVCVRVSNLGNLSLVTHPD